MVTNGTELVSELRETPKLEDIQPKGKLSFHSSFEMSSSCVLSQATTFHELLKSDFTFWSLSFYALEPLLSLKILCALLYPSELAFFPFLSNHLTTRNLSSSLSSPTFFPLRILYVQLLFQTLFSLVFYFTVLATVVTSRRVTETIVLIATWVRKVLRRTLHCCPS